MICRLCNKYIWDGRITSALFHLGIVHNIEAYGRWNTDSPVQIEKISGFFRIKNIQKSLKGKEL